MWWPTPPAATDMKNVCIVGYGAIAPVHAGVLEQLPSARLYAVCDTDPAALAACKARYDVIPYDSYEAMLSDPDIDVVHICTPHHLHFPMIQAALKQGKQVVVEKPVTRTAREFDDLLQLSGMENVCVIFQNRYNPCIQKLKALIDTGALGKILGIKGFMTWCKEPEYYTGSQWKGRKETEGGSCLINQALHTLDMMIYLAGPVKALDASTHTHTLQGIIETEDTVEASLQFASGARGLFYASNGYCVNSPVELEVVGTGGTARYACNQLFVDGSKAADDNHAAAGRDYWGGGHYLLLQDYYQNGVYQTPRDITATMQTLFAIYRSAETHCPVRIDTL